MSITPAIFTFYSFKGGVGRSMAAVNVAYALAARGQRVLLVDLDLEAPGVSGFLVRHGEIPSFPPRDVLDLVQWARNVATEDPERIADSSWMRDHAPKLESFIVEVPKSKLDPMNGALGTTGLLHIIGADITREYTERLTMLRLSDLSADALAQASAALRNLFKQQRLQLPVPEYYGSSEFGNVTYDYVLIDSRTGLTELGGLCVGPVADRLVVVCGLNDQNIHGTRQALEILGIVGGSSQPSDQPWDDAVPSIEDPLRPPFLGRKPTLLIASPMPYGMLDLEQERIAVMESALGGKISGKLTYHPQLAALERIFVRDYPREYLSLQYNTLTQVIEASVRNHPQQNITVELSDDPHHQAMELGRMLRVAEKEPAMGEGMLNIMNRLPLHVQSDEQAVAVDRICRWLSRPTLQSRVVGLSMWARLLFDWTGFTSRSSPFVEARRSLTLEKIEETLSLPKVPPRIRYTMHFLRGELQLRAGSFDAAITDLTLSIEHLKGMEQMTALVARGEAYRGKRELELALADFEMALPYSQLPEETRAQALVGRALIWAEQKKHEAALIDLNQAIVLSQIGSDELLAALLSRAMLYTELGDLPPAIEDYTSVISQAENHLPERRESALVNRGELFRRQGRYAEALADCSAVLASAPINSPSHRVALTNRALNHVNLEQYAEAAQDAEAALCLPSVSADLRVLALVAAVMGHANQGNLEIARTRFAELSALPNVPVSYRQSCLVTLGWMAYLSKDYEQAIIQSREASLLDDEGLGGVAQGNLGLALLHTEKWEDGVKAYQQFVEACRNSQTAIAVLKDLEQAVAACTRLPGSTDVLSQIKRLLQSLMPQAS